MKELTLVALVAMSSTACGSPPVPPVPTVPPVHDGAIPPRLPAVAQQRMTVLVEFVSMDAAKAAADEARLRDALQSLGGSIRGRLKNPRGAILVELPVAALEDLRRVPGVRSVGAVPDAERWPGLPDR